MTTSEIWALVFLNIGIAFLMSYAYRMGFKRGYANALHDATTSLNDAMGKVSL